MANRRVRAMRDGLMNGHGPGCAACVANSGHHPPTVQLAVANQRSMNSARHGHWGRGAQAEVRRLAAERDAAKAAADDAVVVDYTFPAGEIDRDGNMLAEPISGTLTLTGDEAEAVRA